MKMLIRFIWLLVVMAPGIGKAAQLLHHNDAATIYYTTNGKQVITGELPAAIQPRAVQSKALLKKKTKSKAS